MKKFYSIFTAIFMFSGLLLVSINSNAQGYNVTLTDQCNTVTAGTETLSFTGTFPNANGAGTLVVYYGYGDLGTNSIEYLTISGETGPAWPNATHSGGDCAQYYDSVTYTIPMAQINAWAATGNKIDFTVVAAAAVNNFCTKGSLSSLSFCTYGKLSYPFATGPNDAGATSITPALVCPGSDSVKVSINNYGTNQIDSVWVNWRKNGTLQTPIHLKTLLDTATGTGSSSAIVNLGLHTFTAGNTESFEVWTTLPNGVVDTTTANDTTVANIKPSMTGTYSIGGTSPDYATFTAAAADLKAIGVCGAVTFNVWQGTYNEQVDFALVPGASAVNNITFRPDPANTSAATISYAATNTTNNYVVRFSNSEYITWDSINVTATGTTFGYGVYFLNADYVTVKNCDISGSNNTSFNSVPVYNATGVGANNCTLENNKLSKGYYGLYWYGGSTTQKEIGNKILNNEIKDFNIYGMMCYYQGGNIVEGNVLEQRVGATSTSYGLYVYYNDSCKIRSNKVTLTGSGTNYGLYINRGVGSATNKMEVTNNMIVTSPTSANTSYGSYISYTKYLNFYHNSINCRGGSATAGRALTVFGSTSTLYGFNDIKNNIFANSGLGQAAYLSSGAISTFLTGMDYNIFTAASGNLVSQNGTLHTTLASWQTASSLDSNSIAAIPGFFSQTDLHLQGGVAADAGANVGVMVDIDGDTRPLLPSTGYDIGADEYIPPTCPMGYGLTGFNLTSSSVDVTWTVGSNDTTWIFEYGAPGFTPGSGTSLFSTNDTATISGLTPVTDYCVYVRGICAAGDTSLYFGPYCFKTRCVTSMSGTYTIDNSSPTAGTNFNSFADAMTELNNCGVSGPTVLLVDQGTYTEQVDIGAIVGASSTNTITFRADPTNTAPAILTFGATTIANNFVIEFTGAEHVIIDSLTITATGPTYGYAVSFRNAEHVTIKNCEINATNNTNFRCVPVYNHTTATHITENCTIENNKLNKGYYGMYWYGINTTQKEIGNKILNNEIKDFYLYGIMCYYQGGNTVEGNVIEQMPAATSTSYGMYVYYNDSCKIKSNKVTLTGAGTNYGLYINRGVGSATNKMEVINNMVSTSPSATRTAYGAYISYTKHLNFYHNSIHVRGGSATAGRALTCFGSTSTLYGNNNIRNNIFANSGPGNAMYINTGAASSAFLDDMDNNIYEASSGNYFNLNGTVHTTMAAYTTASNLDSNSLTGFPGFISGTDLHLQGAIAYDNGDSTVGVMVDIDGDPRPLAPSTGWDIGADEYIPPTCPSPYSMILDSVSTTAAWITWTNGPADSIWELQYGAPGFALGSGTTIGATTKPGMISGLTHSTCYEVWLRSICTVGDTSTWTGPFKFCTKCAPVTDYCTSFETTAYQVTPFCWDTYINTTATAAYIYNYIYRGHTGSNSIRFYNQNDAAGTFMLIAPAVSNLAAGTHRASFWAEGDSTIIIGTMSDPSDPATFTIFDTLAPQSGWTHYKVDFSSYAGTDSHVAILWDPSNTYDFMYLDDYCWEPIPSCEKAPSVTILNPGGDSTSMNIGWNLDTTQVSYIIAYGDSAYDPVTNPAGGDTVTSTTNFKQITGLKSLTEYCFWVKAICKNGDTSFWDGPHCAKTGCPDGIKPPYFDDFSAYQFVSGVGEVLPQCWSEAKGYLNTSSNIAGPTSFWTYDGFANVGFNGAAKVYVGGTNRNEWFVSPTFNLGSDPNVARIIEFDAALTRSGSATAPLRGLGHDDTVAFVVSYDKGITWKKADILIQWDSSGAPSHTGDHIVYEMKNTTGFVKFGFYAVSRITNEANEFFVDNFSIRDTTYASVGELTLEDQFKVYPNPNSGEFTILNKGNAKRSNVKLLDIQGRVVYDNQHNFTQNGQKQIQVTNLNSGVYVLLIQSDGKLEQHRVVIQ